MSETMTPEARIAKLRTILAIWEMRADFHFGELGHVRRTLQFLINDVPMVPSGPKTYFNPVLGCHTRDYVAEYAAGVDHIHCQHCDRQYPTGMWARGPDGRRRCPSPSCKQWQVVPQKPGGA